MNTRPLFLYLQGSERRLADVSHVGPWLGGLEGGLGSVGFGQRERVRLGDVCIRTSFSRGVFSIRQLVPLLLFSKLHTHTHTHTVFIFDERLRDLGPNSLNS